MRVPAGERRRVQFLPHGPQPRHEGVLQHRVRDPNIPHRDPRLRQGRLNRRAARHGIFHNDVQPVAESLDIFDNGVNHAIFGFGELVFSLRQIGGVDFQPPHAQAIPQFGRRAGLMDLAEMHQRHLMAALGFIQIRRGHHDGQSLRGQVRQGVPKLAPRNRIDARGRLIQQQNARLRHQRARQRKLLLHAAAQTSRQPVLEAVHVEQPQIAVAPRDDLFRRHAPQIAHVPDVLVHAQIRVQAKRLRQVADRGTHFAGGFAEHLHDAGGRLHDPGEDLEGGGLAGAIGTDEAENLALADFHIDPPDRFDGTVVLAQVARAHHHAIRRVRLRRLRHRRGAGAAGMAIVRHLRRLSGGHASPITRTSPSAGMPGLAKPNPLFNPSFTPTTCFTRSSRK